LLSCAALNAVVDDAEKDKPKDEQQAQDDQCDDDRLTTLRVVTSVSHGFEAPHRMKFRTFAVAFNVTFCGFGKLDCG